MPHWTEGWGAGRASTMAEKRISARLAAQPAETTDGPDSPFFPHVARQLAEQMSGPDLSAELGFIAVTPAASDDAAFALSAEEVIEDDLDDFDLLEDL